MVRTVSQSMSTNQKNNTMAKGFTFSLKVSKSGHYSEPLTSPPCFELLDLTLTRKAPQSQYYLSQHYCSLLSSN